MRTQSGSAVLRTWRSIACSTPTAPDNARLGDENVTIESVAEVLHLGAARSCNGTPEKTEVCLPEVVSSLWVEALPQSRSSQRGP